MDQETKFEARHLRKLVKGTRGQAEDTQAHPSPHRVGGRQAGACRYGEQVCGGVRERKRQGAVCAPWREVHCPWRRKWQWGPSSCEWPTLPSQPMGIYKSVLLPRAMSEDRAYVPAMVCAVCGQCYHQKSMVWAATLNHDGVRGPYCPQVDAGSLHCRLGPGWWCLWSRLPLRTLSRSVVPLQPKVVLLLPEIMWKTVISWSRWL